MRQIAQQTVALIHRALAWTFAVVGLLFLLFPNGTVRTINGLGSIFGVFQPAPESQLRFWLSLGVAYMALVTILAWRIGTDPSRHRGLMPILAAGKFTSSFTCLLFFVFVQPTFLYLLNFLVDGSIVLIVVGCYAWLGAVEQASAARTHPEGRVAELLAVLTSSMAPTDGAETQPQLVTGVWRYFAQLHPMGTVGLKCILYALEFGPYVFGPRWVRFSRLAPAERQAYLAGWESSHFTPRRQLINGLKLAFMLQVYDSPEACAAIGYDGGYLRDKLLAGPNAEFHRARLGRAREARGAG